jgi:hypothetical protein
MLKIIVEQDSRKLGGSTLLIPFKEAWLEENTCRDLLRLALADHLDLPNALGTTEQVKMLCMRQQESTSASGRKTRVDQELANATACLDCTVWFVVESFSTQSFHFKITSIPNVASSSRAAQVNAITHST